MAGVPRIAVVATSSPVWPGHLAAGVGALRSMGIEVEVHPAVTAQHFTYAGMDDVRAAAFWEYATSTDHAVIWCARGGYGATRLLPLLDDLTSRHGPPPGGKLLVGYSDVTALHEYVRTRWNWHTLHAPMPGTAQFTSIRSDWMQTLLHWVCHRPSPLPCRDQALTVHTCGHTESIRAPVVGGNLAVLAAMAGTPYALNASGAIVFIEDVGERFYRIDRMVTQLHQAGCLRGAVALVLGEFSDCTDEALMVLDADGTRSPLRPQYSWPDALDEIFLPLCSSMRIPLFSGLPVGHGAGLMALPLGAEYQLNPDGHLDLHRWEWIG